MIMIGEEVSKLDEGGQGREEREETYKTSVIISSSATAISICDHEIR